MVETSKFYQHKIPRVLWCQAKKFELHWLRCLHSERYWSKSSQGREYPSSLCLSQVGPDMPVGSSTWLPWLTVCTWTSISTTFFSPPIPFEHTLVWVPPWAWNCSQPQSTGMRPSHRFRSYWGKVSCPILLSPRYWPRLKSRRKLWDSKPVLLVLSILPHLLPIVYSPRNVFTIINVQTSKSGMENFILVHASQNVPFA